MRSCYVAGLLPTTKIFGEILIAVSPSAEIDGLVDAGFLNRLRKVARRVTVLFLEVALRN